MISPELLRRFPFFGFMDDRQLKKVAKIAEELTYQVDEVILESGQPADALYFLIGGNVLYYYIVKTENNPDYYKEYFIDDINPGEIFGISALIEPYKYTATLRVGKPCRVIKINANTLRALCEGDDALCKGLLKAVAKTSMERLENTRVQLIAAQS